MDNENKYEQRVRQRAEEFAAIDYPISFELYNKYSEVQPEMRSWSMTFYVNNWRVIADKYIEIGRLSVQREAEAYRSVYSIGRDMENDPYSRAGLKTMLQSLGLVPENEEG